VQPGPVISFPTGWGFVKRIPGSEEDNPEVKHGFKLLYGNHLFALSENNKEILMYEISNMTLKQVT
jgi:hypothetical protein